MKAVLWVGFPRCGKGTQTDELLRLGHPVLVTGKALKALAKTEPQNANLGAVHSGALVSSDKVNLLCKQWLMGLIMKRVPREIIHFDGLPRKTGQLDMIDYLRERGYDVYCVWFTTPPDVCNARPPRPDRPEDTNPTVLAERERVWHSDTLPLLGLLPKYGISVEKGNLLLIDNTKLTKQNVAEQVIRFLKLPFAAKDMFPAKSESGHGATARSCEPGHIHHIPNKELVLANMAERYKLDPGTRSAL